MAKLEIAESIIKRQMVDPRSWGNYIVGYNRIPGWRRLVSRWWPVQETWRITYDYRYLATCNSMQDAMTIINAILLSRNVVRIWGGISDETD